MVKIVDNNVWRGMDKIGWVQDNRIFSHSGDKLGYFSGNDIFNHEGRKIGFIEGDKLIASDGREIRLEENRAVVSGGSASDMERAAIRLLLGD